MRRRGRYDERSVEAIIEQPDQLGRRASEPLEAEQGRGEGRSGAGR